MKIIISPAKKMNQDTDTLEYQGMPVFLQEAQQLKNYMKSLTYEEAKAIWKCNDKIAALNYQRFAQMDLKRCLTPALLAYEGIQYQYMAPAVFEDHSWEYVEEHLRILSGFYGVLKPFDGIVPYRLEMQAKIHMEPYHDLYTFWNRKIFDEVYQETDVVLNLASREYSKCMTDHLTRDKRFITCRFGELKQGKVIETGTKVKMARGEMVRFLAQNNIENAGDVKGFRGLDYVFAEEFSDQDTYVFLKEAYRYEETNGMD